MLTNKVGRLLPILFLLSTFLLVSCGVEQAAPSVEADAADTVEDVPTDPAIVVERVEVSAAGFSAIPPAGYIVNLDDPEGIEMLADESAQDHGPAIVIFGGEFGEEMTADQMYEFMVTADETLGDVERLPYDNPAATDGFVAEFSTEDDGTMLKGRLTLTLVDGQGTLVTAIAPAGAWETGFNQLVDAVQASIEYFPPAES